jgi:hypothetical protein
MSGMTRRKRETMPTGEEKTPSQTEMFEAVFDRVARCSSDLDEVASRLATTAVMRLFLRRRALLLGLPSPTSTPGE